MNLLLLALHPLVLVAQTTGNVPIFAFLVFWGLLFMWLLGIYAWRETTWWPSYNGIVLIVLFGILGWFCLGNPLSR